MSKSDEDWSEDQDSSQEEASMSVNPPLNDPNGMGQQATNAMDMDVNQSEEVENEEDVDAMFKARLESVVCTFQQLTQHPRFAKIMQPSSKPKKKKGHKHVPHSATTHSQPSQPRVAANQPYEMPNIQGGTINSALVLWTRC